MKQPAVMALTDRERDVLEAVAAMRGLTLEQVIADLWREGSRLR